MSKPILSAEALEITAAEHSALLEVRAHFAAGVFKHDPVGAAEHPDGFNMNSAQSETDCGTTCCIGGWVWHVMSRDRSTPSPTPSHYVFHGCASAMNALYFPSFDEIEDMSYEDITTGAALAAIDNFLTSGEPDWRRACGLDQTA